MTSKNEALMDDANKKEASAKKKAKAWLVKNLSPGLYAFDYAQNPIYQMDTEDQQVALKHLKDHDLWSMEVESGGDRAGILYCAAALGATELCEEFLKQGLGSHQTICRANEGHGESALAAAINRRFDDIGALLIRSGEDPMATYRPHKKGSMIFEAIWSNLPETVRASVPKANLMKKVRVKTGSGNIHLGSRELSLVNVALIYAAPIFNVMIEEGVNFNQASFNDLKSQISGFTTENLDYYMGLLAKAEQSSLEKILASSPAETVEGAPQKARSNPRRV